MSFLDKVKKASESFVSKSSPASEEVQAQPEDPKAKARVDDVLDILQIPATFEIPADVFLPDDLKNIHFDIQVPQGYDTGQVTRYMHQTRNTVVFLTDLLKKRNEHVAKLATTIDRLQVDINNQRFENEIANGISVMPTDDAVDIENELMEAKLTIRRLEDKMKTMPAGGVVGGELSSSEKQAYSSLLDEVSLLKRKNTTLEDENVHLRTRLASLEEADEDDMPLMTPVELSNEELSELGLSLGLPNPDDLEEDFTDRRMPSSIKFADSDNIDMLAGEPTLPQVDYFKDVSYEEFSLEELMNDDEDKNKF